MQLICCLWRNQSVGWNLPGTGGGVGSVVGDGALVGMTDVDVRVGVGVGGGRHAKGVTVGQVVGKGDAEERSVGDGVLVRMTEVELRVGVEIEGGRYGGL